MSDTDTWTAENASAAAPAPVVPPAAEPLPPEPETPAAPAAAEANPLLFTQRDKDVFRANIRWLMAELDWARAGRTAEEREKLNP